MTEVTDPKDPKIVAAISLLGATGAEWTQIRYSDDEDPVVWMAVSKHGDHFEAQAGMTPVAALFRLAEILIDGGTCTNCNRPTGVSDSDTNAPMPIEDQVCWWKYIPDEEAFLRGCDKKKAGAQNG